jgi:hypothetical protein
VIVSVPVFDNATSDGLVSVRVAETLSRTVLVLVDAYTVVVGRASQTAV